MHLALHLPLLLDAALLVEGEHLELVEPRPEVRVGLGRAARDVDAAADGRHAVRHPELGQAAFKMLRQMLLRR